MYKRQARCDQRGDGERRGAGLRGGRGVFGLHDRSEEDKQACDDAGGLRGERVGLSLIHIFIERADILFGRGFNALTGETGAGKSIVIDALGAVLGQRTSRELISTGAAKAFVLSLIHI